MLVFMTKDLITCPIENTVKFSTYRNTYFWIDECYSGESIFNSGGTGSLGVMTIPIAKSLGLKVITSSSERSRKNG